MECWINVENLEKNFMLVLGEIKFYFFLGGLGVWIDLVVYLNYKILLYYDLMIVKVICYVEIWEEVI